MQLARATDFSLRVLMLLANTRGRATSAELAAQLAIPREQMMKIVQRLAKAGYVETARGKHGGIHLAVAAETITLGEVVRRIEPRTTLVDCRNPACPLAAGCRLKAVLDRARDAFLDGLDVTTLAAVATLPGTIRTTPPGKAATPVTEGRKT